MDPLLAFLGLGAIGNYRQALVDTRQLIVYALDNPLHTGYYLMAALNRLNTTLGDELKPYILKEHDPDTSGV